MKTTHLNLAKMALYLFMGLSITLVSCSGEDGADGMDGVDGEQGPPGADGQDGNANVMVSDWMHLSWNETQNSDPATWGLMYIEEIPGIDDINAFMETGGVVLFYIRINTISNTATYLMPYEQGTLGWSSYIYTSIDQEGVNGFVIRGTALDVADMENTDTYMVRYVVVPANVAEANGLADKMPESFGEAAALLGLE